MCVNPTIVLVNAAENEFVRAVVDERAGGRGSDGVAARSVLGMTSAAYAAWCLERGVPGGRVGAIERCRRLFRTGDVGQAHLLGGGPGLGSGSGERLVMEVPSPRRVQESESGEGTVRKFTLALTPRETDSRRAAPGAVLETESVIIPMIGRRGVRTHTLCVSSQVGCAMGCGFCQTAQMGLIRQLTAEEIVAQWYAARHVVEGYQEGRGGCDTIRNIVFMGMGEPTDNLEAVLDAVAVLTDHNAAGMPMSKVTISTVGRLDGIARLAERVRMPGWHRLNLAVSLNAPNDEIRSKIMPVNRAMPLDPLRSALEQWPIYGAAKLCIEYVLIPGVNDGAEHAVEVGDWVLGRGAYAGRGALPGLVNLIPYNPREHSPWRAPTEQEVDEFLSHLLNTGVYAKRRRTKGRDQMAACGQLGSLAVRKVPLRVVPTV